MFHAQQLAGYTKVGTLGQGAFAEVFEVVDEKRQSFALKCIPTFKYNDEILIHQRLEHTNIVRVHECIKQNDRSFLVLELCKGGTLREYVQKRIKANKARNQTHLQNLKNSYNTTKLHNHINTKTTLNLNLNENIITNHNNNNNNDYNIAHDGYIKPLISYEVVRRIVKQLCSALQYLHNLCIVHRDINLNNILFVDPIDYDNDFGNSPIHIKVSDFGLAADLKRIESKGKTICGTPGFIAPEVINGQDIASPINDAYSVGALIYALVIGEKVPSDARKIAQLKHLPPLLEDLLLSSLETNPNIRLDIDGIQSHPFILGQISTLRIPPIVRRTRTLELSIDTDGNSIVRNLSNRGCIESDKLGNVITITNKLGNCCSYKFQELPKSQRSKYHCLYSFVDLVRSKVAKVNLYCKNTTSRNTLIEKCCIMEDGSYEVTIGAASSFESQNRVLIFNRDECIFKNDYLPAEQIKIVCNECRKLEIELELFARRSINFSTDIFPASFGKKPVRNESYCSGSSRRMREIKLNSSGDDFFNQHQSYSVSSNDCLVEQANFYKGKLTVIFNDNTKIEHNVYETTKDTLIYWKPTGFHTFSLDAIRHGLSNDVPVDLQIKLPKVLEYISKIQGQAKVQ